MYNLWLVIGALLPVVSGLAYIRDIIQGRVRPQVTTRLLLAVITVLSFVSLLAGHDRSGVWLALTSCIQSIVLWILSLRKGIGSLLDRLDIICFGVCMVGIVLWLGSGESIIGLLASIVADFVACIPSLRKTWRLPHSETVLFYALDTVAGGCILAGARITWAAALFPAYIMLINLTFVIIIVIRRSQERRGL